MAGARAEQLVRLRDEWRRLRRTRRQRYFRTGVAVAAAASVAIVAISFSWRVWRKPTTPIASPESVVRQQASVPDVRSAVVEQSREAGIGSEVTLVREPNLYERVVLTGYEPASQKQVKRRTAINRTAALASANPIWREWLDEAALLTPVDLARWSGELVLEATRYRQRLWTTGRLQAGRLVASAVATVRHAQAMARASSPQVRSVEALVQQADLPDLVSWLVQEPDRKLRRRLLVELVLRGTDESVGTYLAFVVRPECRQEAARCPGRCRTGSPTLFCLPTSARLAWRYEMRRFWCWRLPRIRKSFMHWHHRLAMPARGGRRLWRCF